MVYNWKVTNLFTLDEGTKTNYVVTAFYEIIGAETVDGKKYTASFSNSAQFEVVEGNDFIPYDDLKNDTVIEWVKTQLGQNAVNSLEESVASMIEMEINPPISPQNTELPVNFNSK